MLCNAGVYYDVLPVDSLPPRRNAAERPQVESVAFRRFSKFGNIHLVFKAIARDFRSSWKELALTGIAYKIISFIVLTPIVGGLFRTLVAVAGKTVLTDQDILFFFLGPVGWICFIVVGALFATIVALEQSALMGVLCAAAAQRRMSLLGALQFAKANAWPVIRVTVRMLALTLVATVPFLLVAGLVYATLLDDYDINYYLQEKPPVFLVAVGIGGVLIASLVALLLRLFSGWFFALPVVIFEDVHPSNALSVSRERSRGHRRVLLWWIVVWALASFILSLLATAIVVGLARLVVPKATGSLALLAVAIGVTLILWTAVNMAVNLLSTTTFAAVLFNLYRRLVNPGDMDLTRLNTLESTEGGFRFTRKKLLFTGVMGGVVAIATGVFAIRSVHKEDNTEVTAHRGSSKAAPENTMAAVKKAIEDGADWVEIDVQETADGEVVLFHDSDFMKLAGVNLKIWDATMADLRDIDIGSWFGADFKDERVPTLADVLAECKGKAGVNIELKYYGHDKQLEQRVVDIVEAHDMASDIVIMSLKIEAVRKMKSIRPDWKAGLLMSVSAGGLKNIDADFLAVNATFADRRFIRNAHGNRQEVYVWTVNDAPTMSTMIGRGVDNLITDKPALARSVIEQRAQMGAPERILLELAGNLGVVPDIGEP